jgi:hypothetical protein
MTQSLPINSVVEYIVRYLDALERVVMGDIFISVMAFLMASYLMYHHIIERKARKGEENGSL